MWIAKPLQSLSGAERAAWVALQEQEGEIPLSQTLAWGDSIVALGGSAYLVFSPEERVGGVVHSAQVGVFECINGPCLHWDDPDSVARQFATFAMAVTRLGPSFSSLRVQPRWAIDSLDERLQNLPIPPREVNQASTLHVRVQKSEAERLASVSSRLRRSILQARRAHVQVKSWGVDPMDIAAFSRGMKKFGQSKGFFVPDEEWLQNLVHGQEGVQRESLWFFMTEATSEGAVTRLLTCIHGSVAHYLMGYEERDEQARSSISTSAAAHFHVLEQCASQGIETYDLNGFTDPSETDHPYAGVSQFKAQFLGEPVHYASPVFVIENS
jgi:hypothetical protein